VYARFEAVSRYISPRRPCVGLGEPECANIVHSSTYPFPSSAGSPLTDVYEVGGGLVECQDMSD